MSAVPNDTAKALIRNAIDDALQAQIAELFRARCNQATSAGDETDPVLIALAMRDEFYARHGIEPRVNP